MAMGRAWHGRAAAGVRWRSGAAGRPQGVLKQTYIVGKKGLNSNHVFLFLLFSFLFPLFFFCSSYLFSSPFLFSLPGRIPDPGSQSRLFSPLLHNGTRLAFLSQDGFIGTFFLVDSRRIVPTHATIVGTHDSWRRLRNKTSMQ